MTQITMNAPKEASGSVASAWLRALEMTAPIPRNPHRLLSTVIEEQAGRFGSRAALLSERECFTYAELAARMQQYARWALACGIRKGEVVGLLMPNRPEYLAIWLGITSVGAVVALLNTSLAEGSLAHCIDVASPNHIIVADELAGNLSEALSRSHRKPQVWVHGGEYEQWPRIEPVLSETCDELRINSRQPVTIEDRALCIFTSGTTGLPKAANVSHGRIMQWSHWFAGMMGVNDDDCMYNCLPMFHSVGGVQAPGAMLAGGGSIVLRPKFSASRFWDDVTRWDCSIFQYIGELCRYLSANASPAVVNHRIRMACGNGMSPDVWGMFQERFRIPQIFEFYASTEGGVSLFNIEGKAGSIGRVPGYLAHRFSPALLKIDIETGEPVRDANGFCTRAAVGEPGEAIGKMVEDASSIGTRFEGYTDEKASQKKILRNVFKSGDAWIRTGDLMRKDEKGFFYFVDRMGDTFRWKGENVSTAEVAEVICQFPGISHVNVYGVSIPGTEGRIGMAALVMETGIDLPGLRKHMADRLPVYARPAFLRLKKEMELTGTFKYSKTMLVREGYDPEATSDEIYFDHPGAQVFVRMDSSLYSEIQRGCFPL